MTFSRASVWCLVCLLCCSLAFAGWEKNGFAALSTEWSKSKRGFAAALLLTAEPEDVLRDWNAPGGEVPVRTTEVVPRGVPIVAFVFFAGCRADRNGLCDASIDFTILKPDGSEYNRFMDRDLWKQKPAPPDGMLRLSAEYVGVVIEPSDPLGEYTFNVTVHDLNAGTSLELSRAFTATEAPG